MLYREEAPLIWSLRLQQMLAWGGLLRYGFQEEAERLAYKWLYMVTKAFVDFNGIVVEKYDVTRPIDPHKVDAEYGSKQKPVSCKPRTRLSV